MSIRYRVYLTPLASATAYGTETEITDYVIDRSIAKIRRGVDSTDYQIGSFFFDDVKIKLLNVNGKFNENDQRSIFFFGRDLAKVRVVYSNPDGDTITFRGIVNEEATRIDATKDQIEFRILSRNSVIRNARVSTGSITSGTTAQVAMFAILNQAQITKVLTVSLANINPANNITVDDASVLANLNVMEAMNQFLLVTNSVMLVNSSDEIIVRSRDANSGNVFTLYGPYDIKRRQNIISISNYNEGKHRVFTAVKLNNTEKVNSSYIEAYGYKKKSITAEFITDGTNEANVAQALLDQFRAPKIELEVTIPVSVGKSLDILDKVSLNHPLRITKQDGKFFPIIGQTQIGDTDAPLPGQYGSIAIEPEMGFKILEIKEDPSRFEMTLKLRQIGDDIGDGFFTVDTCAIIGFSIIGVSTVCGTGDTCATFNPATIGAAKIGCTQLG